MTTKSALAFITILFLLPGSVFAQVEDYFPAVDNGHRVLMGSPNATTRADTIIANIAIVLDSTISWIRTYTKEAWSLTPFDFTPFAAAKDTARTRNRLFLIPGFYSGPPLTMTAADSNLLVWDFRYGQWKNYGRRTWGFNSVVESDSLNRLQKVIDSTTAGGLIQLGDGTWTCGSVVLNSKSLRLVGTAIARPAGSSVAWPFHQPGTNILSSSTSLTEHLLRVGRSGVDIYNISLVGNNRLNGCGFYGERGDGIATTQGDYSINNSLAIFNGGDGIRFTEPDGNTIHETDSFNNKGYGITVTTPYGDYLDGYRSYPASNEFDYGIAAKITGGRTRFNSLGGLHSFGQSGAIITGLECISDSTQNVYLEGTDSPGSGVATDNRGIIIGGDFEFALPRAGGPAKVQNMRLKNVRNYTMMNTYIGSTSRQGTYTTDSGTNTTQIQDTQIIQMPSNYYIGWYINNSTRASGDKIVTASSNSGGSTILTHASISGQTSGDTYVLERRPNYGMLMDSVYSFLSINNNFPTPEFSQVDTTILVKATNFADTTWANLMFLGAHPNFDPKNHIKALGRASVKWVNMQLDRLTTNGVFRLWANTKIDMESTQDSIVIDASGTSHGVRIQSGNVVDLQPGPTSSASNFGDVRWNSGVANNVTPDFRFYADVDTSAGVNRQYLAVARAAGQKNALSFSSGADSVRLVWGMPQEVSGNDLSSRFIDVLTSTAFPTPPIANNRVRLYGYDDKLWTKDDGGDTLNITPYKRSFTWNPANIVNGASQDTSVSLTGIAPGDVGSAGLSSIAATGWRIEVHSLSANNVNIRLTNNTGGDVNLASGTVKVRMWK